jgi:hypothetical protein
MSFPRTIALLSTLAFSLLLVPSVANAQYTGSLGRCIGHYPGPTGKACCLKIYTIHADLGSEPQLSGEVKACVESSARKK